MYCCTGVIALQALRGGKVRVMDAVHIVPGDVLIVRLGDIVPADIKILGEEEEHGEEGAPMQVGHGHGSTCCTQARRGKHAVWFMQTMLLLCCRHCKSFVSQVPTRFLLRWCRWERSCMMFSVVDAHMPAGGVAVVWCQLPT
eukprot:GHRQ01032751.1.p1 GENE.GHRQ01032751.1~~GHRQ01032751.1.p1  ORF type:complete len:142 (-),score=29.52 GHRQ01032751.1:131-556(-)